MSTTPFLVHVDSFFDGAKKMRRELDARLADDRDPFDPSRFAWEPWHVFGQFSQLRAPARSMFSAESMSAFERRLLAWAQVTLGASELGGPPWLSSLKDGDYQALHRDSPNGEFAFSFGLSRSGSFKGGETLVATFDLLDYFRRGAHESSQASSPLFASVASRMNRLVAFDARIPHSVRAVEGPRHVRDGRIAIQGWLRARGCVSLAKDADVGAIEALATKAIATVKRQKTRGASGLVSVRVQKGRARVIVDTLANTGDRAVATDAAQAIVAALAQTHWPPSASLIVPVIVDADGARIAPRHSSGV